MDTHGLAIDDSGWSDGWSPTELTPSQLEELQRRMDEVDTHRANMLTWEQIKAYVKRNKLTPDS
jgi:hypothetical protein